MHNSGISLDLYWFLQLIATSIVLVIGLLHLVKNTASKYFVVDANFDEGGAASANSGISRSIREEMLPVSGDGDACFVCGNSATKKCSRCKAVRYCSQSCQETDWKAGHKLKCMELKLYGNLDSKVSVNSVGGKSDSLCTRKSRTAILSDPVAGPCNTLQQPKVLFPYDEFVKLFNWDTTGFAPCGLLNCGNSCFANVVLQCLSCTRPLIAYLLERGHRRECRRNDWCFLCELQVHVERASRTLHPFSPINILSRLTIIGGNLGHGKQEDAHEFMRFAIDTMQTVCLDEFGGEKSLHPSSQETTLIQHIFGGYLQSQVICTKCNKISNRYESMMDLTVEIQGDAASLEDCLNQFTVQEWLDGENMYKCDGCNDYVKAWKRLTVHQAPNILTIALKRFQGGRFGKLNKRVTFPETLDLGPYMSKSDGDLYKLYAVVVHLDMLNASYFGHYICYTKDFDGNWYRIDDCKVVAVELEEVLAQGAYMLLYSRMYARPPCVNPFEPSKNEECQPLELTQQTCSQPVESLINGGCTPGCLLSGTSSQSHESGLERDFSSGFQSKPEIEDTHDMNMIDLGPTSSNLKVLEDSDSRFSHTADTDLPIEISSKECPDRVSANDITSVEILKDEVPISYNDVASNFKHESEAMDEEQEMAVISPEVHVETLDSFAEFLSDKHPTVPNTNLERAEMIPKLVKDNSSSVTKPKPLFRSGFLNKSSADKPLKKEGIALTEPCIEDTSCKMKSTCNGFSESGISRQNKNGSVNNGHISPSYMKNPCGNSIDELKMTNKEPNEVIYTHISDSNENIQKYKLFDGPQPLENASSDKERESEEPCETPHCPFKIEMNGKRLGDGSLVTSCEKGKNIKLH